MASPEPAAAVFSVDDIFAFSNAELADFMKKNRRPDGSYGLPVDGGNKLSNDQRNQLAQRLISQGQALSQSPTALSCPLDLDKLDARLRDISDDNGPSSHPLSQVSGMNPESHRKADAMLREKDAYHELVDNGGRPLYPIDLLEDVLENPDAYHEMLKPWLDAFSHNLPQSILSPHQVFEKQQLRWRDFRRWQQDNRGVEDGEGGFPAYIEKSKEGYAKQLARFDANPSPLELEWQRTQFQRQQQRYYYREYGCHAFPDYIAAVKHRLERHNFTQPFQLKEDPRQQDKLATWIEYLNFELWWFDRHTENIKRLEPDQDKVWKELADLRLVRAHETKESIRTAASMRQEQVEMDQAWKALQSAKSEAGKVYLLTQQDPNRLDIPRTKRISLMKAASARITAAKDRLESLKKRRMFDYEQAKKGAARQSILLPWVLEQVPLIQAEVIKSHASKAGPGRTKRTKRSYTTEDDAGKRGSKRQKLDHRRLGPSLGAEAGNETALWQ